MNIRCDMQTLSPIQVIASWIPFKSKKLFKRWAKHRSSWIDKIELSSAFDLLTMSIYWKPDVLTADWPHPARCTGISFVTLWDDALKTVAKIENMRDVNELAAWLDSISK